MDHPRFEQFVADAGWPPAEVAALLSDRVRRWLDEIESLVADGDRDGAAEVARQGARRVVRVGAVEVVRCLREIEQRAGDSDESIAENLVDVQSALSGELDELDIEPVSGQGRFEPSSPAQLSDWLNTLRGTRLNLGVDPGELETLHRVASAIAEHAGGGVVQEAAQAVIEAEEAKAASAVDRLLAALGPWTVFDGEVDTLLVVVADMASADRFRRVLQAPDRKIVLGSHQDQAQQLFDREKPSLVILDLVLPDGDSRRLIQLFSAREGEHVPVLVRSAHSGDLPVAECYALGAERFLPQPLTTDELQRQVSGALGRRARREREAGVDPVTGLPNRASVVRWWWEWQEQEAEGAVGLIGLEGLGEKSTGHYRTMDEAILRQIVNVLQGHLPGDSRLARWGSEELLVFAQSLDPRELARRLEAARSQLADRSFPTEEGEALVVGFSAGVVAANTQRSLRETVTRADDRLYRAQTAVVGAKGNIYTADDGADHHLPRALVAEDDRIIAALIEARLSRDGIEVETVADGGEAARRVQSETYNLLLLDLHLPTRDGFDVAKVARQGANKHTPLMVIGTGERDHHLAKAFALGADDFLTKPFSPQDVGVRARRLMRQGARRA